MQHIDDTPKDCLGPTVYMDVFSDDIVMD